MLDYFFALSKYLNDFPFLDIEQQNKFEIKQKFTTAKRIKGRRTYDKDMFISDQEGQSI